MRNTETATEATTCSSQPASNNRALKWTTAAGLVSALGVCAACCLLPFALLSAGVAGAWISTLDALSRYKWIFIAVTAGLLGYGFYAVYWKPRSNCAAGRTCRGCGASRSLRIGLWVATILAVSGIVFEQLEPMLVG